jgi:hypothetical protein
METIRTPEKEIALTEALREKPSVRLACRRARISRNAYYDWIHADPAFKARMDAAKEQGCDALEDALVDRALKTDTTAAIFLLKAHRPETYRDTHAVTHEGGLVIRVEYADDHPQPA